jgi:hypothetical protein
MRSSVDQQRNSVIGGGGVTNFAKEVGSGVFPLA